MAAHNHLAGETSPYLLQHAHNPVEWYPWGSAALERARHEDKPIFLSIGYAACHWCHVMERESFEDPVTAAELARDFISIKVDREERPDLDQVYMGAVQAMTGQGGWPMSMFLTPDGRPFYGGTYFPATPRGELPAFRQVLAGVARAWREQRPELEASGDRLVAGLAAQIRASQPESITPGATPPALPSGAPVAAVAALEATFDAGYGGWGRAPKFPQPMTLEFLLRRLSEPGADADGSAGRMLRTTLDAMA
ncbi:MAG TPA: thioredoxin domain-containing protein, partial [Candidatus Limnocylindrales bacterium]